MIRAAPLMKLNWNYDCRVYRFSGKLVPRELEVNNFSFLAAMMLAYQPIRSLATLNLAAYQGSTAFKRISKIIDKDILIKKTKIFQKLI